MIDIYVATEDRLSQAVANRLILEVKEKINVAVSMGCEGNGYLKKKLPELIRLSKKMPVFLITDLDSHQCPSALIKEWHPKAIFPKKMLFRVAVREIESWLLADKEGFSEFSGIPLTKITSSAESLNDPKQELINIVSKYGRKDVKQDIMPKKGTKSKFGIGYNNALIDFVAKTWNPQRAACFSDSLARARQRLILLSETNDLQSLENFLHDYDADKIKTLTSPFTTKPPAGKEIL